MPVVTTAVKASTRPSLTRHGVPGRTDPDLSPERARAPRSSVRRTLFLHPGGNGRGGTVAILRFLVGRRGGAAMLVVGAMLGAVGLAMVAPGTSGTAAGEQTAASPPPEGFIGLDPVRILDTRPPGNGPVGVTAAG